MLENYEYDHIACSFAYSVLFLVPIIALVYKVKGKFSELVDIVAFNAFPGILKIKKDNNYNTLVYLSVGRDKVLLKEKDLNSVKNVLFWVSFLLVFYMAVAFGFIALIEYSYDCENGKDCFVWPHVTFLKAERADCSDPDIKQGKKLVVCYTLALEFAVAGGITFGIYRTCAGLLNFCIGAFGQCSHCCKCSDECICCWRSSGTIVSLGVLAAITVITALRSSDPIMRISSAFFELIFSSVIASAVMVILIVFMPWKSIKAEKDELERLENQSKRFAKDQTKSLSSSGSDENQTTSSENPADTQSTINTAAESQPNSSDQCRPSFVPELKSKITQKNRQEQETSISLRPIDQKKGVDNSALNV